LTPGHRVAGVTPRAVAHVRKEVSDVVELESRAAGSSEAAAGEAHRRARPVAVVVRPAAGLISSLPIGYVTAPASFGRSRRSQGERCSSSGCDHDSYPIQLHPHAIPSLVDARTARPFTQGRCEDSVTAWTVRSLTRRSND